MFSSLLNTSSLAQLASSLSLDTLREQGESANSEGLPGSQLTEKTSQDDKAAFDILEASLEECRFKYQYFEKKSISLEKDIVAKDEHIRELNQKHMIDLARHQEDENALRERINDLLQENSRQQTDDTNSHCIAAHSNNVTSEKLLECERKLTMEQEKTTILRVQIDQLIAEAAMNKSSSSSNNPSNSLKSQQTVDEAEAIQQILSNNQDRIAMLEGSMDSLQQHLVDKEQIIMSTVDENQKLQLLMTEKEKNIEDLQVFVLYCDCYLLTVMYSF